MYTGENAQMIDWENLRHFLAVAQIGTLSGAARRLKVDHATVSRRLAALEAELQMRLVDRLPRACQLTAFGQQVFQRVAQMEAGAFAIERAVQAEQSPVVGQVTVSAPPFLAANFLAERFLDFRKRRPRIRLSVLSEPQNAAAGQAGPDIAVRLVRPAEPELAVRRLGTMEFALYARRDYVHLHQPSAWEFVAYDAKFAELPHPQWLRAVAGERTVVAEVSDIGSLHAAVGSGVGVAGLPCFLGDADAQLQRLTTAGQAFSQELWLAVLRDRQRAAPVRAVVDFIVEAVKASPLA